MRGFDWQRSPHSRLSSFQQEVDQNNPARIQFLSDGRCRSALISPGCYFWCCKPVIILGMKWTQNMSKVEEMYFFTENTRKVQLSLPSDKQGQFSVSLPWIKWAKTASCSNMLFYFMTVMFIQFISLSDVWKKQGWFILRASSIDLKAGGAERGSGPTGVNPSQPASAHQVVVTSDLFSLASIAMDPIRHPLCWAWTCHHPHSTH